MLKIAVLAPIPSASVTTAVAGSRGSAQHAHRVDEILAQRVDERMPRRSRSALRRLDAAERQAAARRAASGVSAGAEVVVDVQLGTWLRRQVAIFAAPLTTPPAAAAAIDLMTRPQRRETAPGSPSSAPSHALRVPFSARRG
jgi:hypothetical protein